MAQKVYIPGDLAEQLECLRNKFGDERISQTARRILRVGLEKMKAEEGRTG
jgi:predicted RNA binding protein with dsRBD fold (UPF0201 family)